MLLETLEARRLLSGDIDLTFGDHGRVVFRFGGGMTVGASAMQPDGKILVAGGAGGNAYLARFNADGSTDTSFDLDGLAKIDLGGDESFRSIVLLPGGKILVAGRVADRPTDEEFVETDPNARWVMARFRADGALDSNSGFGGTDGIESGAAGSGAIAAMNVAGGKIVTLTPIGNKVRRFDLASGAADSTFAAGGTLDLLADGQLESYFPRSLTVNSAGEIAVVGYGDPLPAEVTHGQHADRTSVLLVMLDSTGQRKNSFDGNGILRLYGDPGGMTFRPDGVLLLAADNSENDGEQRFFTLYRIHNNGTFGEFANTAIRTPEQATNIGIASGGKIYIGAGGGEPGVVRFNADGTTDTTYSDDGVARDLLLDLSPYSVGPRGVMAFDPDNASVVRAVQASRVRGGESISTVGVLIRFKAQPAGSGVSADLQPDGTLLVTGSDVGDDISFQPKDFGDPNSPIVLFANRDTTEFPAGTIRRIVANLGDGRDGFSITDDIAGAIDCSVSGGTGDDAIIGAGGDDTLRGEAGNDWIFPGRGTDQVFGGDGIDKVDYYGSGFDPPLHITPDGVADDGIAGENDNVATDFESFIGSGQDDYIVGTSGDNFIQGASGKDTILAGGGNDVVSVNLYDATVDGGAGNDTLTGGARAMGGDGNDRIDAAASAEGGAGDDVITGKFGRFFGGDGNDYLAILTAEFDSAAYLDGGIGNDTLGGGIAADTLIGGDGNDILRGAAGKDKLNGGAGNDLLYGQGGNDQLLGGPGSDRLWGGAGNDYFDAGLGGVDHLNGNGGDDTAVGAEARDILISIEN